MYSNKQRLIYTQLIQYNSKEQKYLIAINYIVYLLIY